ncbi:MAG TPA: zf-HC2 domain-containing protein [Pyrinomonadaceae bacterium]|jgi:hypothetical protein
MALSNHDQTQIREYLLGKLNEEEQQRIEERLMVEDELFDEFEASKDELIEDYCDGELSQNERQWLEEHFLVSNDGRQRRAFALAMKCFHVPVAQVNEAPRPTWFQRFKSLFRTEPAAVINGSSVALVQPWTLVLLTSVVLVALIGLLVGTRTFSRGGGITFTGPTLASNVIKRGAENSLPKKVKLPRNAASLKLRLLLPKDATPATRYEAELDDRINTKQSEVVEFDNEAVSVVIPADQIPRGEYSLKLTAIDAAGARHAIPGEYLFNTE